MHNIKSTSKFFTTSATIIISIILIATVAAFLRFWKLQTIPPGHHYDEAFNTLYALRIARGEILPVFITENNGEEPMHIYLIALLFKIAGPTPIGGRVVSATVGVFTAVLVYLLTTELFHELSEEAKGLGLIAGLFWATWYWTFHYNRIGMEPSMVPLIGTAAIFFIWRARRTNKKSDAVFAGIFTGLSLYTYPAGRAIPILATILALYGFTRSKSQFSRTNIILAVLTSAVIILPLGIFFSQQPQWFLIRPQQVTSTTIGSRDPIESILQGIVNTVLGLFWRGDENWRQNLPGRPIFDPIQTIFFLVGVVICLRNIKKTPNWFLLLWAVSGLIPTTLTEYTPHFGRALGAAPPLAIIASIGIWTLGKQIAHRLPTWRFAPHAMTLAMFFISGSLAFNDYFNRWAKSPELYISFDVGLRAIGEYAATIPYEHVTYLSPVSNEQYTLTYALESKDQKLKDRLRTFDGRKCLILQKEVETPTHYIIVTREGEDRLSLPLLQTIYPAGKTTWETSNREFLHALDFLVPAGEPAYFFPKVRRPVIFSKVIELKGFDLNGRSFKPGELISLNLWWSPLSKTETDYTVFIHLVGQRGPIASREIFAQHDSRPCNSTYLTKYWSVNEVILDRYQIRIPLNIPDGVYNLKVGLYNLTDLNRAKVSIPDNSAINDAVPLTQIEIVSSQERHR